MKQTRRQVIWIQKGSIPPKLLPRISSNSFPITWNTHTKYNFPLQLCTAGAHWVKGQWPKAKKYRHPSWARFRGSVLQNSAQKPGVKKFYSQIRGLGFQNCVMRHRHLHIEWKIYILLSLVCILDDFLDLLVMSPVAGIKTQGSLQASEAQGIKACDA